MKTSLVTRTEVQPSMAAKDGLVGVDYERVDPSTRHFIHTLFPSHTCGHACYLGLLANAIVKQYAQHSLPREIREDVAVVRVKGYAELSQRIGLSYDTTHMYVLIMHALGLLYIETQEKQMTIIIPLGAYRPPAGLGEILLQLQVRYSDRRPKVRCLINNIIKRIMSLIQKGQEVCEQPSYEDDLLAGVQRGLSVQGVTDPDGQIAMSVLTEITPFISAHTEMPTVQVEQGIDAYLPRFYRVKSLETPTSHRQEFTFVKGKNQVEEMPALLNLPDVMPRKENRKITMSRARAESRECGRFCMQNLSNMRSRDTSKSTMRSRFNPKNLLCGQQVGDVAKEDFAECGRFSGSNLSAIHQAEDTFQSAPELTSTNLPLKVDSEILLSIGNGGNGNGEKNINNISLTDPVPVPPVLVRIIIHSDAKQQQTPLPHRLAPASQINQAKDLAKLIEGDEKNVGTYIVLIKQHHLRTLRAAVIATLLREH